MASSDVNDSVIDAMYRATDGNNKNNEAFKLGVMSFNEFGPQLVSGVKMAHALVSIPDLNESSDSEHKKLLKFMHDMIAKSEAVLFSTASIDGKMLDTLITRKQKAMLIQPDDSKGPLFSGLFGNNNNSNKVKNY